MEQKVDSSLFGLSIDPVSKMHLWDTARWAKFLAMMGFIVCGLIVLIGIFAGTAFEMYRMRYDLTDSAKETRGLGALVAIAYILLGLLGFFPSLFLFHFATKMKMALMSNDQNTLNTSFQNLKKTLRYVGVVTIILLVFFLIAIFFAVTDGLSSR